MKRYVKHLIIYMESMLDGPTKYCLPEILHSFRNKSRNLNKNKKDWQVKHKLKKTQKIQISQIKEERFLMILEYKIERILYFTTNLI